MSSASIMGNRKFSSCSDILDQQQKGKECKEYHNLLLETMKPPSTKTTNKVKVPRVLATTCVLPTAAMNRKRDNAVWCTAKNAKNCRKNLNEEQTCQLNKRLQLQGSWFLFTFPVRKFHFSEASSQTSVMSKKNLTET